MPSVLKEMEAELKVEKYDDTDAWDWTTPRDQFIQRAVPSE